METKIVTIDMDFTPAHIDTYCHCGEPVKLKHTGMGRYEGACACGQLFRGSKRKKIIREGAVKSKRKCLTKQEK